VRMYLERLVCSLMRKYWEVVESERGVAGLMPETKGWVSISTKRQRAEELYIPYQKAPFTV